MPALEAAAHAPQRTGLSLLRERIAAAHVPKARPDNLRLATWNIREFGKGTRFDESIHMIAAILATFDLVAVIELQDDMRDMHRVLARLGPRWSIRKAGMVDFDAGTTGRCFRGER